MSSGSTSSGSLFRIGGLASGIDTNTMIDQLMALERRPINKLNGKKQTLSWKNDFWTEIKTSITNLDNSIASLLKKSTMLARTTTAVDNTIATATATSDAALGKYTVNVVELATSTTLTSGAGGFGISGAIDPNAPVSSYTSKFNLNPTAGTFTVNGVMFTLSDTDNDSKVDKIDVTNGGSNIYTFTNASGITLNNIKDAFNNATVRTTAGLVDSTSAAVYDPVTDKFALTAAASGPLNLGSGGDTSNFLSAVGLLNAQKVTDTKTSVSHLGRIRTSQPLTDANFATPITGDASGNGKFTINGVEITYNKSTDTLQTIIDRINASTAGVNAAYDSIQDKLVLSNKNTGSISITTADVTGNFMAATKLLSSSSPVASLGKNARFTINGGSEMMSLTNDVSSVVPGVTFTLKKQGASTDITIDKDTSKAKDAIKTFVDKYNAALTLINSKLDEEKVKDPKNDSDRKKGLLRGDKDLSDIKHKLVDKSTFTVAGLPATLDQLAEIGITITKDNYGKSGQLVLDEAKLDAKLSENPGAVANLFFNDTNGNGKVDAGEDGVAARIDTYMDKLLRAGGTSTVNRNEAENTAAGIIYTGSWSTDATDSGYSGGQIKQSSTVSDSAKLSFIGTKVEWFATKNVGLGTADVWVDGVFKQSVNLSAASKQNKQSVYSLSGLSDALHTIEIKVNSGTVNIDAIDVTSTDNPGSIVGLQDRFKTDMDDIDDQVKAMEERLDKREDTLIKQFAAMELAVQRMQDMSNRFQTELKGMLGNQ